MRLDGKMSVTSRYRYKFMTPDIYIQRKLLQCCDQLGTPMVILNLDQGQFENALKGYILFS